MSLKAWTSHLLLERRYGLDTFGYVDWDELGYAPRERYRYEPSSWPILPLVLPRHTVGPEDVFADLGSGEGRIVFQAALRYGLKRVIGVGPSPKLHEIATTNVERNWGRLRCRDVELVNVDALDWEIPEDLTIVYMYNAFLGELFSSVAARLADFVERRGRGLRLIQVNPVEHERLMATGQAWELPAPNGLAA